MASTILHLTDFVDISCLADSATRAPAEISGADEIGIAFHKRSVEAPQYLKVASKLSRLGCALPTGIPNGCSMLILKRFFSGGDKDQFVDQMNVD
jgi:hypothetical protein